MHQIFRGQFFNFEAVRILGMAGYGGAEVAEFLDAVGHIQENDPVSWHGEWTKQAEKAETVAHQALHLGHRTAARMAFLRASNYTRSSAYMMTGPRPGKSDPRTVPIIQKVVELFRKALRLLDYPVHVLEVPYQGEIALPAYLYLPQPSRRLPGKIPIVINIVGADSMQEEIYYMLPAAGPDLGYAVLTFEGPGQGLRLHEHNIPMRPDWEVVTMAVIDYLAKFTQAHQEIELDLDRIAVAGASLGGYFALRAAADSRIKACVAIDPLYDLWDFATRHVSPTFLNLWSRQWISDWLVNNVIWLATRSSFQMKWDIATSARFLGVSTPTEILRTMKKYTLRQAEGSYLDQVVCPVLVSGAANSLYLDAKAHTTVIFEALKNPGKELWLPTEPSQGSLQAKMGAIALCNQHAFAFLDRCFNIKRREIL